MGGSSRFITILHGGVSRDPKFVLRNKLTAPKSLLVSSLYEVFFRFSKCAPQCHIKVCGSQGKCSVVGKGRIHCKLCRYNSCIQVKSNFCTLARLACHLSGNERKTLSTLGLGFFFLNFIFLSQIPNQPGWHGTWSGQAGTSPRS